MSLQRIYKLEIEGNNVPTPLINAGAPETLSILYPLTLDFDVVRNTLGSPNTGSFTIYNLSEDKRAAIFHDRYDTLNYRQVRLFAGYDTEETLPEIYRGNIQCSSSARVGQNWLTKLEVLDGYYGMANGQVSISAPKTSTVDDILKNIAQFMPKTSLNAVGNFVTNRTRGVTIVGNCWDMAQKVVGAGSAFIDRERVNFLAENEYIIVDGEVPILTGDSGLLNTPRRQNAILEVDLIFYPNIVIGQIVEVRSLEKINNGLFQVRGIRHRGTISGAVDGGVRTTLSLWAGTSRLTGVRPVGQLVGF